jgi:hypothetical protein
VYDSATAPASRSSTSPHCCCLLLQLLFKEDCSVDDLIDVIEGNRRYVKCLYVYNKVKTCAWMLSLNDLSYVCMRLKLL